MNPYLDMVLTTERLLAAGKELPLGGMRAPSVPAVAASAKKVVLFSPHPDDECIVGALALRLRREARMNVVNVAVTMGSNKARQSARLAELKEACAFLAFGLVTTRENGLEKVNPKCRETEPAVWKESVGIIARIMNEQQPDIIFMPHGADANTTHIGTHHLVLDALATMPGAACTVVETEFWAALSTPNLMVASSAADVADLMAATSYHAGEVMRNPYHLRLPAWMSDNVRRGGELVGGQGGAAPEYAFATLYRVSTYAHGALAPAFDRGRQIAVADNPSSFFA
jgi:LmbE family N-acetylglucosaminyl deacetylase